MSWPPFVLLVVLFSLFSPVISQRVGPRGRLLPGRWLSICSHLRQLLYRFSFFCLFFFFSEQVSPSVAGRPRGARSTASTGFRTRFSVPRCLKDPLPLRRLPGSLHRPHLPIPPLGRPPSVLLHHPDRARYKVPHPHQLLLRRRQWAARSSRLRPDCGWNPLGRREHDGGLRDEHVVLLRRSLQGQGSRIRLCLGGNNYTDSDPFISALEMIILEGSVYNSTDFDQYALGLVARSSFGHSGPLFRYPNDTFNRYWQPFVDRTETIRGSSNVSDSELWNLPPRSIFETALVVNRAESMQLQWPHFSLPNASYYIALYFANPSSESSRALDVSINGINFYNNLRVTSSGICIFASKWVLSGATRIILAPSAGSNLPPLINGGEVFSLVKLGGLTESRDVLALEALKKSFVNPPPDWSGDPCLPHEYSWTGIKCSGNSRIRVVKLNLSTMNLSGTLSPEISKLTGLNEIYFSLECLFANFDMILLITQQAGNNNISGQIPNLSRLRNLAKLHLQGNNFSGVLPPSLGRLSNLRELFVEKNRLRGKIPASLLGDGLTFRYLPGNNLSP
ncbi:unnamed protein product [Spirodela intermedia]|uniref:Uncharacterized protein n=1 Tax=Spirodela intermedia TaxID=51605 RepID=A0A7I8JH03_SPIIN|nr:unnamed protein product [Spirodela intermedia]CAA6669035.1 unnamed protein product [Spirodela intermedia]